MRYVTAWIVCILATNYLLLQATVIRHQDAAIHRLSNNCPNVQLGTFKVLSSGIVEDTVTGTNTCIYDIDAWVVLKEAARLDRKY